MANAWNIGMGVPPTGGWSATGLSFTGVTIDGSADRCAWQMQAQNAEAITHVKIRYQSRGAGTPVQHRVSLQALDASGLPTGTVLGGGSPASATFTPPADTTWDGTVRTLALANSYTPARGEMFAVVIDPVGTPDASNYSIFSSSVGAMTLQASLNGFPSPANNTGAGYTFGTATRCVGVVTANTRYGSYLIKSSGTTNVTTAGHRTAMQLILPAWCSTFKLSSFSYPFTTTAGRNMLAGVWDSAGNLVDADIDAAIDTDVINTPTGNRGTAFCFAKGVALTPGTTYYIGLEVVDTPQTISTRWWEFDEESDKRIMGWEGRSFATWNGSAWSVTNTYCPPVILGFEDLSVSAGSPTGQFIGG